LLPQSSLAVVLWRRDPGAARNALEQRLRLGATGASGCERYGSASSGA
jgi:hypothetical protein